MNSSVILFSTLAQSTLWGCHLGCTHGACGGEEEETKAWHSLDARGKLAWRAKEAGIGTSERGSVCACY